MAIVANRGRRSNEAGHRRPRPAMGMAALAALVAVAAIVAALAGRSKGGAPAGTGGDEAVKAPRPAAVPKPVAVPRPAAPPEGAAARPEVPPAPPGAVLETAPLLGGASGQAPQEEEVADTEPAPDPVADASTNRVFKTGLEQIMGWVFTTEVGDPPPPLPMISDFDFEHIGEILASTNAIAEFDSDRAADAKATVDFVKGEFREYLDEGGDPQEFLEYYHSVLKEAYEQRQVVHETMMELLADDPGLVEEYLEKANGILGEKGIKPVDIPPRLRVRYGLGIARPEQ